MNTKLYSKIFKALNEDLNMILPEDEFEERIPSMKIHMENTQKTVYINKLINLVNKAIDNEDTALLKNTIENEWNGEFAFYPVNNDNIKTIIEFSITALEYNAKIEDERASSCVISTSKILSLKFFLNHIPFSEQK